MFVLYLTFLLCIFFLSTFNVSINSVFFGEDAVEHFPVLGVDQSREGRKRGGHIVRGKVPALRDPGREQIFMGDEIAEILLDVPHALGVILREGGANFPDAPAVVPQKFEFLVGKELVEDEAEDVVLVTRTPRSWSAFCWRIPRSSRQAAVCSCAWSGVRGLRPPQRRASGRGHHVEHTPPRADFQEIPPAGRRKAALRRSRRGARAKAFPERRGTLSSAGR